MEGSAIVAEWPTLGQYSHMICFLLYGELCWGVKGGGKGKGEGGKGEGGKGDGGGKGGGVWKR